LGIVVHIWLLVDENLTICHYISCKFLIQCRCRKLPRALKEWSAFEELKQTIDDFNDMVPLLELMSNKAMKPRHWQRMAETTGHVFDVENENFTLRNILEAPLLANKEDIEVCII
jgi:dynein heavy chain